MEIATRQGSHYDELRSSLLTGLETKVIELRSSTTWQDYLTAQARFHRYSPRNVLLISMQRPEATQVAGFSTWRTLGRRVGKGERGISILAPIVRRVDDETAQVAGFRWVSVFDISQTTGTALPSPVELLDGDDPAQLEDALGAAANDLGFQIVFQALPDGVNGECRWREQVIAIEAANSPMQRVKTIVHELGHALLHRHEPDRGRAEVEAEAVAFVVLAALGADTASYSVGYVASWLGADADVATAISRSCASIQSASATILEILKPDEV